MGYIWILEVGRKAFFGEVVGNCFSLSLFASGHDERTMKLPSPSFSRLVPKRQRTGAVHDLADIPSFLYLGTFWTVAADLIKFLPVRKTMRYGFPTDVARAV